MSDDVKKVEDVDGSSDEGKDVKIFGLRTVSNREEQVMDFMSANVAKKKEKGDILNVFSLIHPHGMKGYVFVEAASRDDVERASFNVPYAKGILPNTMSFEDISHIVDIGRKVEVNIKQKDIVEIITAPYLRSQARITRVDHDKGKVVIELLDAAVAIPMTRNIEDVRVIRRDDMEDSV